MGSRALGALEGGCGLTGQERVKRQNTRKSSKSQAAVATKCTQPNSNTDKSSEFMVEKFTASKTHGKTVHQRLRGNRQ